MKKLTIKLPLIVLVLTFTTSLDGVWDRFNVNTVLPAGEYTVVLNQTSSASDSDYYKWFKRSDIGDSDNEYVCTRIFSAPGWTVNQPYDIPLLIESIAYEDASNNPRNFTGVNPNTINFQYNGTAGR